LRQVEDSPQRNFGAAYQSAAAAMLDERLQNLAVCLPFQGCKSRQIEAKRYRNQQH
jgi:hypothetical protein